MPKTVEDLLKRPLYVFDLPQDVIDSLEHKALQPGEPSLEELDRRADVVAEVPDEDANSPKKATACALCGSSFLDLADQRHHFRSDWHGYNLKRKQHNLPTIDEIEFEKSAIDLDESISGSGSSSTEDEAEGADRSTLLSHLLQKQANLQDRQDASQAMIQTRKQGAGAAPLVWFSSTLLPSNTSLGIYRGLFTKAELDQPDLVGMLRKKQLTPPKDQKKVIDSSAFAFSQPNIFLCMIGGGHFAGMIVSLIPKVVRIASGHEEREAIVVSHKTFHRYTTRRKQGGSQSANDSAKGAAHSAGAGIRRYNEAALESEVRSLLNDWRSMLNDCHLHFVRATGMANRRTLFGPYEGQVLHHKDPRNRTFPFSTRRATQTELMRAFIELTRTKIKVVDDTTSETERQLKLQPKLVHTSPKPPATKRSKEEESMLLHTSQLQALIKRSKVPAVLSYISSHSLSPNFAFYPPASQVNRHASTPLHLASSINSSIMVLSLLTKAGADPCFPNGEGKVPFDLAGDRPTRDAFRVARSILGEHTWDWDRAKCPPAMTKGEADMRDTSEREASQRAEFQHRRAETERLERESRLSKDSAGSNVSGKSLVALEITAADRREQELRGLTPEFRAKLERERRAKAAEARIAMTTG